MKLDLNQKVLLTNKSYTVTGIDYYELINMLGKIKKWTSYTMIDENNNKTWISYGGTSEKYFTQWFSFSEKKFQSETKHFLNLDLTGIANIEFEGNQGHSLSTAEIVCFNLTNKRHDFLSIERFLELKGQKLTPSKSYYLAGKILKDFKP